MHKWSGVLAQILFLHTVCKSGFALPDSAQLGRCSSPRVKMTMKSFPHVRTIRTLWLSMSDIIPVFLITIAGLAHSSVQAQAPWTGFLDTPIGLSKADIPMQWSPTSAAWSIDTTGYGQSSPVIWNDRVYITSVSGLQKEQGHVVAIGLNDGKILWQYDFATASGAASNPYVSRAAPTPVVGPQGLVCFFEGGDLLALDHDGNLLWKRNLVEEYGPLATPHGLASSLAASEGRVFVWVERKESPYLLAVNPTTGENIWKIDRNGSTAWSSPIVAAMPGGQSHLILSAAGSVAGYDMDNGDELWRLEGLEGNSAPTPRSIGPGKLLIGASVGREGGASTKAVSTNGLVEVKRVETADGQSSTQWQANYVWQSEKATCSFCSPASNEVHAYYIARGGILYCLELKSGEQVYMKRLPQDCWATPIVIEDRIYLFGKDGETTVIAGGTSYEVVASNLLWNDDTAPALPPSAPRPPRPDSNDTSGTEPSTTGQPDTDNGAPARRPPSPESASMVSGPVQYAAAIAPGTLILRSGTRLYAIRH